MDWVPSYRLLLPLSSTCRHFYELIHEESVSAVVRTENAIHEQSVRVSCWHRHPRIRVATYSGFILVDRVRYLLKEHDASFVSCVLTSLRRIPFLELVYWCPGGPHAANLHPLRHFTRLRSLWLLLGEEHIARRQNVTANLSTALLTLPSLVCLTVGYCHDRCNRAAMVESSTLRRLTSDRLVHVTLDPGLYEQLMTPDYSHDRRKRNIEQSYTFPRVLSITSTGYEPPALSAIMRVFPSVKHVALDDTVKEYRAGRRTQLHAETPLLLDSLHMYCWEAEHLLSALRLG